MLALVAYSLKLVKLLGPCKRTQHCWPTTPNNVGSCWHLLRPFAWAFTPIMLALVAFVCMHHATSANNSQHCWAQQCCDLLRPFACALKTTQNYKTPLTVIAKLQPLYYFNISYNMKLHSLKFIYLFRPRRLRLRPHYTVFKRKRYCFVPDTATTTLKTITENGSFPKRSPEWNDLKTELFENAVFQVSTAKTILHHLGCRPLNREYPRQRTDAFWWLPC